MATLQWRGAMPDATGCWVEAGFTFEKCCVPWGAKDLGSIYRGNPACWTHGFTYDRCCLPPEVPRDFFSCDQSGSAWRHFREGMGLSKPFTECGISDVLQLAVDECLLGGVLAALVHIHMTVEIVNRQGSAAGGIEGVFDRGARLLWLVLNSPLSLDEILSSGWPLFKTLLTLAAYPRLQLLAAARLGDAVRALPDSPLFSITVARLLTLGERVPSDKILSLVAADSQREASHPVTLACAFFATAYSLRVFGGPVAPPGDQPGLEAEARRLLALGYAHLRDGLLALADPLSGLLAIQLPVASLLHGLQMDAVVAVDPLRLVRRLVNEYGFPPDMLPRSWLDPSPAALPQLELHVLPYGDSVSNSVRTHRQPFCHDFGAFLRIIAAVGHAAMCRRPPAANAPALPAGVACPPQAASPRGSQRFRLWEVGANLGDCSLWAIALLEGFRSQQTRIELEAHGFEPAPWSASAFRRSISAFHAEAGRRAKAGSQQPPPRIRVSEVALGDASGTRVLGVPPHSWAESTFNGCDWRYHENFTGFQCDQIHVRADTIDRQLSQHLSPWRRMRRRQTLVPRIHSAPIDLLKVHVQGDELRVLRGARQSLSAALICVVLLKMYSVEMIGAPAIDIAAELRRHLHGFRGWLVDMAGTATEFAPGSEELVRILDAARRLGPIGRQSYETVRHVNLMLVAYHAGATCRNSLAVSAVRALWGEGGRV